MVRTDTGRDSELELLGLGEALGGEIAGVEAILSVSGELMVCNADRAVNIRSRDDDLSINQLLIESRVLAFLVGGGDEGMALVLEPFAETKLVLGRAEQPLDLVNWNSWSQLPFLQITGSGGPEGGCEG